MRAKPPETDINNFYSSYNIEHEQVAWGCEDDLGPDEAFKKFYFCYRSLLLGNYYSYQNGHSILTIHAEQILINHVLHVWEQNYHNTSLLTECLKVAYEFNEKYGQENQVKISNDSCKSYWRNTGLGFCITGLLGLSGLFFWFVSEREKEKNDSTQLLLWFVSCGLALTSIVIFGVFLAMSGDKDSHNAEIVDDFISSQHGYYSLNND